MNKDAVINFINENNIDEVAENLKLVYYFFQQNINREELQELVENVKAFLKPDESFCYVCGTKLEENVIICRECSHKKSNEYLIAKIKNSNMPSSYWGYSFTGMKEEYKTILEKKYGKLIRELITYIEAKKRIGGLYVHGKKGAGKTYVVTAILKYILKSSYRKLNFVYINEAEIYSAMQEHKIVKNIPFVWQNDIFIIDDFGNGVQKESFQQQANSLLGTFFREINEKHFIIASHMDYEELRKKYGYIADNICDFPIDLDSIVGQLIQRK